MDTSHAGHATGDVSRPQRQQAGRTAGWRRRVRWAVCAALAAVIPAAVGLVAIGSPAAAAGVTGPVTGIAGKCLNNNPPGTGNGNPVSLWACIGGAAQTWTLPGDGTIRVQGNQCLAVQGHGTASMTPVWTWTCDGGPGQTWTVRANGTIVNDNSGLCLADSHANTADGNPIWVYTCDAGPAQLWHVPASVDPSGQSMPVGDLPGWHQVFTDDFATPVPLGSFPAAVSSRWTGYSSGPDTHGTGRWAPDKVVSVGNGLLNMHLHTENGAHLVAAPIPIIPGHGSGYNGQTYGRYAVRFRADPVAGYNTAWLLWPDPDATHPGGDWNNGEIDFPEGSLTGKINAYLHHRGNPTAQEAHETTVGYDGSWHTAVLEWAPSKVTFTLDGNVIGTDTNTSIIPNSPMHWILQTETGNTPPTDSAAGDVQVDWVSIWSRT